jgi:4-hydroxybenzoate polyprenyltransferase
MFKHLLKSMRPKQWTKNAAVFAALIFDRQLFKTDAVIRTIAGFILFCLVSSSVYLFNDIMDIESDKKHPTKRNRPIAAGKLPVSTASVFPDKFGIFQMA